MRKLPSLNALRAFESAARHSSFTAAAGELHVTQAAVSRSVKQLEAQLGRSLFARHANALALTDAGRLLLPELTASFDRIAGAVQRASGAGSRPVLTVGVGPTFAMRWLIPRLGRFQAQHPGIDIHITTGGAAAPLRDEWTCSVTPGRNATAGVTSLPLFSPWYSPVCAPRVAKRLREPKDLYRATLLDVRHAPKDWSHWLAKAGVDEAKIGNRVVFEFYAFAMQAALDGVGVAIGLHPYIVDDLAAGRLVAPFELAVRKEQGWYLTFRDESKLDPHFSAFMEWIAKEARAEAEGSFRPRPRKSPARKQSRR
jgi:LysR family glycine cleavage system transcriptional activator/LysR family transcriptional regulator of beta-lactamase